MDMADLRDEVHKLVHPVWAHIHTSRSPDALMVFWMEDQLAKVLQLLDIPEPSLRDLIQENFNRRD